MIGIFDAIDLIRVRRVCCALVMTVASAPAAQAQLLSFPLTFPDDLPHQQRVSAGGEGRFEFTARNDTAAADEIIVEGLLYPNAAALAQYAFVSATPQTCPPPVAATVFETLPTVRFNLSTLAAGASLTCSYRVVRALGSRDDIQFRACPGPAGGATCHIGSDLRKFYFGTLPAATLSAERVGSPAPGDTTSLMRLTVRNMSDRTVASRPVATDCWEFKGGVFGPPPFQIENNFAGACPTGSGYGVGCVDITGTNFSSLEFDVGPIAPGGSASCLVRLRTERPPTGQLTMPIYFPHERVSFADGGLGFDTSFTSAVAVLAAGSLPTIPTTGLTATIMLALLILAGALAYRHRHRSRHD